MSGGFICGLSEGGGGGGKSNKYSKGDSSENVTNPDNNLKPDNKHEQTPPQEEIIGEVIDRLKDPSMQELARSAWPSFVEAVVSVVDSTLRKAGGDRQPAIELPQNEHVTGWESLNIPLIETRAGLDEEAKFDLRKSLIDPLAQFVAKNGYDVLLKYIEEKILPQFV